MAALPRGTDEPPLTVSREAARRAAEEELSKSRYHDQDPSLFQRGLNRFWDWVGDLLGRAADATPGGGLGLFVVVLLVLLAGALLWWRLGSPTRARSKPDAALFDDRPRTAAEHRAAAETHAAAARWNAAVQERMRALVRSLEERALLDPRPGRTADEAAAEAARLLPGHTDELRAAAQDFDHVTYGDRSADASTYTRLSTLDQALEQTRPVLTAPGGGPR